MFVLILDLVEDFHTVEVRRLHRIFGGLISFRVVRFAVKEGLYETVITNLPADRFPPPLLRELYHKRWGIETSFRDLKYTLALTHFHAKKRSFIKQEIFSRMTLYNFASLLRLHAIFTQSEGKYLYRLLTPLSLLTLHGSSCLALFLRPKWSL